MIGALKDIYEKWMRSSRNYIQL